MFSVSLIYLLIVTVVYLVIAAIDGEKTLLSLKVARQSLWKLLPLLIAIFGLVGLFQEFLPPQLVEKLLGESGGLKALFLGGALGAVSIGPPLASYPLAGALLDAGAWAPAVAAFILSWISIGIITLPFEAQIFTLRFALFRNGITFIAALISGLFLGLFL